MTAADIELHPGHAKALAIVAGTPIDHFCMPTNSTRPWSQGHSSLVHYLAARRLNWFGLVSYGNSGKTLHLTNAGRRLCEDLGIEVAS